MTFWSRVARRASVTRDSVTDSIATLLGRRDPQLPPRRLLAIWEAAGFKEIGETFLRHFVDLAKLAPDAAVLEVGCGVGRIAIPLASYLSEQGSYDGLDIIGSGIRWCRRRITPRHPNFHFQTADVWNGTYQPRGRYKASEYRFPFEAQTFDFVFLTSVFTHMMPDDVSNYAREIARVTKPGGRVFITFFLLNADAEALVQEGKSHIAFAVNHGEYVTVEGQLPEWAVAYRQKFVLDLLSRNGLAVEEPIRYGSWCGRKEYLDYQDIVLATKA